MWKNYGYVMASKYRKMVVKSLIERPKTPSEIAYETKINLSHISRGLRELSKMGIIECVNEPSIKGRVYMLTENGKELAPLLDKTKKLKPEKNED